MATDRTTSIAAQRPRTGQRNAAPLPGLEVTQSHLFEALRELAFESCLDVAGNSLRIGLAVTQWQLDQARIFLNHFNSTAQVIQATPEERVVALALHTGLTPKNGACAKAVVVLRRDGPAGLSLDTLHPASLEHIRAQGGVLVEVEQIAFSAKMPMESLVMPMVHALAGAVRDWGATDILAECPRQQAAMYCRHLGFKRVHRRTSGGTEHVLLHLAAGQIERLSTP